MLNKIKLSKFDKKVLIFKIKCGSIQSNRKEIAMKPVKFAKWLKAVIIGCTFIGLVSVIYVLPECVSYFKGMYPEFSDWVIPWSVLIYTCSVPCFVAMFYSWKIAVNIQNDKSFCSDNAALFKKFSYLSIGDSVLYFLGCLILFFMGMNHPGLMIIEMLIVFIGLAVFVCTAALSYLVGQAADLQEESDLTI